MPKVNMEGESEDLQLFGIRFPRGCLTLGLAILLFLQLLHLKYHNADFAHLPG